MIASSTIATRRRAVLRVGCVLLLVASATACIFDQGKDYQGGGRSDDGWGAKPAQTDTAAGTTPPTPPANPPPTPPTNPPPPSPTDAGNG